MQQTTPGSVIGRLRPRGDASSAIWGVGDQALVSLANFLTMLLLARSLQPAEFGSFVVLYMVLLFAGSLQMTLVTRPHSVLAAPMTDAAYETYTAGATAWQLLLALGLAAMALVVAGVAYAAQIALAP